MLNEQRIEHLRLQIQASALLNDHEKADWLNLLELMNDKQLGELEEILAAPKPAPKPAPLPEMSHISNMPNTVAQRPAPAPAPQSAPVATKAPAVPPVPPPPPLSKPVIPRVLNPQPSPRPVPPPAPARPVPPPKTTPMNPLVIEGLEGLQALSVDVLRQHENSTVIPAVQMLAQSYGYFATLQNFEASPLYNAYLAAGRNRLLGKPDSVLTQAEFELVADLLQAIRLNRI